MRRPLKPDHAADLGRTPANAWSGKAASAGPSISEQAKQILTILIRYAEDDCGWLTYADLARETGMAHCALRVPLDHLSAELARLATAAKKRIPPLQILIVNGKTKVPGSGAWRHIGKPYVGDAGFKGLAAGEQRSVIERIHRDIVRYRDWRMIEQALVKVL